jgi:hypothetical protein
MRNFALPIGICGATLGLFLQAIPAQAQATRTWVSGVGDDVNPCSRTAPCKTFAGAISKTAANGEISVLDPGGFGAVTITKSITLNGEGTLAGILNAGTNGVIVSSTIPAGSRVILRNISINGGGTGIHGIRHLGPAELILERVQIYGQTGNGIDMTLTGVSGSLKVVGSTISRVATGLGASSTGSAALVSIENSQFYGNTTQAIAVAQNADVTITNSAFAANASGVVTVVNGQAFVANSQLANNGTAFNSGAGTNIRISNNELVNNGTNFVLGGTISSAGNNRAVGGGAGNPNGAAIATK